MKNTLFIALLLLCGVLLASTLWINPGQTSPAAKAVFPTPLPHQSTQTWLDGYIEMEAASGKHILVNARNLSQSSDGKLHPRLYILQQETTAPAFEHRIAGEHGRIYYWGKGMVVHVPSGTYLLGLGISDGGEEGLGMVPSSVKDDIDIRTYGYGLSENRMEVADLSGLIQSGGLSMILTGNGRDCSHIKRCRHGGPGAISCAYTTGTGSGGGGCTVNCGSGTFACCGVVCVCCPEDDPNSPHYQENKH